MSSHHFLSLLSCGPLGLEVSEFMNSLSAAFQTAYSIVLP